MLLVLVDIIGAFNHRWGIENVSLLLLITPQAILRYMILKKKS